MISLRKSKFLALQLAACLFMAPVLSPADDIDIFLAKSSGAAGYPNVLLVLDNSSNWASANQGWPTDATPPVSCGNDCNKQGYYELKSLRTVINALPTDSLGNVPMNIGLIMFNNSTASHDGGYVRYHARPMTAANKAALISKIDTIIQNFNTETAGSSVQYMAALFDAFKYFGGYTEVSRASLDQGPSANPTYDGVNVFGTEFWGSNNADGSKPDADAYTGNKYNPISASDCAQNYIVFIGNGFPAKDNTVPDMGQVLKYLQNPASPPSSISELPLVTTTPVYGSCSDVTSGSGAACQTSANCTTALASYTSTTSTNYACNASNCTGNKYKVQACTVTSYQTTSAQPSGNAVARYADEMASFLHKTDVNSTEGLQNVTTYAIDVYKNQQDVDQTALMKNMAKAGGGKYFAATNEDAIVEAFKEIFLEIQSVNTTFASASLPINATNRTQNENQVFIGMFRPDRDAKPRWYGNMKRYQLAKDTSGSVYLAGVDTTLQATNSQTGFLGDCVASFWTSDSANYWESVVVNPSNASKCTLAAFSTYNKYSDAPDGPFVEKGGVAEVIRKGNNPPTTNTTATWAVNRSVNTRSGAALAAFNTTNTGLGTSLVNFFLGQDVNDENSNSNMTETRPSMHGDVIHSRPLPINYGGTTGIKVFYGSNDGTLRAVDAATGKENWAFIAPEFNSRLQRLMDNSPLIQFAGTPTGIVPTPEPKGYFFDGSIGVYQNADNSKVWIYPTMRRGGRMVYSLDVTSPTAPSYKWAKGCPNLTNDTGCSTDMSGIGQTWSLPSVAFVKGYSTTTPVVLFGGGYDTCEDADTASPSCSTPKGAAVYVLDAADGSLQKSFSTTRSVVTDVAMVDMDNDGRVDYGYVVDLGGNVYRINFVTYDAAANTYTSLAPADWTIKKIAYTNGSGRKFFFAPALLPTTGRVYLAFGSGDREHPLVNQYPFSSVTNRFYVYLDDLSSTAATAATNLDDTDAMSNYTTNTTCESNKITVSSSQKGWFMNLNQYGSGEQTVTSPLIVGGLVAFSTNRPMPVSDESCSNGLGEARGYWVNLFNASGTIGVTGSCGGARSGIFAGGGLPPSPVIGTVPINGQATTVIIGAIDRELGTGGPIAPQKVKVPITAKRKVLYWKSRGDN